jgi:hypothetical protein
LSRCCGTKARRASPTLPRVRGATCADRIARRCWRCRRRRSWPRPRVDGASRVRKRRPRRRPSPSRAPAMPRATARARGCASIPATRCAARSRPARTAGSSAAAARVSCSGRRLRRRRGAGSVRLLRAAAVHGRLPVRQRRRQVPGRPVHAAGHLRTVAALKFSSGGRTSAGRRGL